MSVSYLINKSNIYHLFKTMSSYIDEKEIHQFSKFSVQMLWKTGYKVCINGYTLYLNIVSAVNRSEYLEYMFKGKTEHLLIKSLEDLKITNLTAFTAFWNWLNGAVDYFEDLKYKDYIDMLDYIVYFDCFRNHIDMIEVFMSGMIHEYEINMEENRKLYLSSKEKVQNTCGVFKKICRERLKLEEYYPTKPTPFTKIFNFVDRIGKCSKVTNNKVCDENIVDEKTMKCKNHLV